MHPILFEIGGFPVYTYGVLLAAAYLLGLQFALMRARARGLDPNRVMDLGIWIIISALVGAKLLLLVVEWDTFSRNPARAADAGAIGRRVLRRADRRGRGGALVPVAAPHAAVAGDRRRSRPASRSATSSDGSAASSPAAASASPPACRGRSRSTANTRRRTSARRSTCRCTRRSSTKPAPSCSSSASCIATERKGRPFPGRTFWGYMLLYGISRFIIEFYRGDARGMVGALSTSQFVSLLIVPLSIIMLVDPGAARGAGPDGRATAPSRGVSADDRSGCPHGRARRRGRARRPAARPLPDRASAGPVALADPAADQGRPRHRGVGRRGACQHRRPRRASASSSTSRSCARRRRKPEALPLRIVFEDPDVVVLDKPAGMVVHPGGRACERHAGERAAAPRQGPERHRRRAAAGHRAPSRSRHLGTDGRRQARRGPPGAVAAVSATARSRRNTSRSSGASCRPGGASTSRSAAIRRTGRRCRPARAGRAAR